MLGSYTSGIIFFLPFPLCFPFPILFFVFFSQHWVDYEHGTETLPSLWSQLGDGSLYGGKWSHTGHHGSPLFQLFHSRMAYRRLHSFQLSRLSLGSYPLMMSLFSWLQSLWGLFSNLRLMIFCAFPGKMSLLFLTKRSSWSCCRHAIPIYPGAWTPWFDHLWVGCEWGSGTQLLLGFFLPALKCLWSWNPHWEIIHSSAEGLQPCTAFRGGCSGSGWSDDREGYYLKTRRALTQHYC